MDLCLKEVLLIIKNESEKSAEFKKGPGKDLRDLTKMI